MHPELPLRCRCGAMKGVAIGITPDVGNHVVCYCDDCQAYARYLGIEGLTDAKGGTEIFQLVPARVRITSGIEHLRCMRLSSKGLMRWYAGCCRTPVGNTVASARVPFMGIVHAFFDRESAGPAWDAATGPVILRSFGTFAIGGMPEGGHPKAPPSYVLRTMKMMLRGLVRGEHRPSAMFDGVSGKPVCEATVLTREEREALRSR